MPRESQAAAGGRAIIPSWFRPLWRASPIGPRDTQHFNESGRRLEG